VASDLSDLAYALRASSSLRSCSSHLRTSDDHTHVLCALCVVRHPLRPNGDRTHALRGVGVRGQCENHLRRDGLHSHLDYDQDRPKRDKRLKRAHVRYAPDAACFFFLMKNCLVILP
jgi:hypothetical protein